MARPHPNYVRGGDVVRATLNMKWANFAYGSNTSTNFKNAVANQGFNIISFDDSAVSTFTGGPMYIDVMPSGDFNNVQDVAGLLGGIATNVGFSVGSSSAQIVSFVENTGGGVPAPSSLSPFRNVGTGGSVSDIFGFSPKTLLLLGIGLFVVVPMVQDIVSPPRGRR